MSFKIGKVDGKEVIFNSNSVFRIEVCAAGKKNYKPTKEFIGDINSAVLCYRATPFGSGYKKRLVVQDGKLISLLIKEV